MKHVYTLANIHEVSDIISDMAKDVFGTRAACPTTPEAQVSFMNRYGDLIAEALEEERNERVQRHLYLNQKHGQTFATYEEAERFNIEAAMARFEREAAALAQVRNIRAEFMRRGSPLPVIEAWEHGGL